MKLFWFALGIVKHQLSSSFYKTIEQHVNKSENENIVWGPNYQTSVDDVKFPHRNGYKRHIVVNLYSSDDGHAKFNQLLTQGLCSDKDASAMCESKQITIDFIDEKLSKMFGLMPDPELALFFGSACCTMGFMPWQVRLTEFIQMSHKLQNVSLDKFLRVLYKYAKCEQRFGK
jgi:dehydrodolichyl diphosphate syntase complex subunit NUS1